MKNRWIQLTIGTITLLFLGLIYAWSIFRDPLLEIFPMWSMAEISFVFTLSMILFCLGIIISGRILERVEARWILLISGVIIFMGFMIVSKSLDWNQPRESLIKLYIFYGLFCGLGVGTGYIAILNAVMSWFPERPGLAGGILLMGFGCGGLVLGTITKGFIDRIGVADTLFYLSIVFFILCGLVSFVLHPAPEERSVKINARKEEVSFTPRQMLRTKYFWLILLFGIFSASGGLMVINSAVPIALSFGASAGVGLVVSIFNGGGRVVVGTIFDKFGAGVSLMFNASLLIGGGILLVLTSLTGNQTFLWIGLPLIGLAFGGFPAVTSAVARTRWGKAHYPVNFGILSTNLIAAAFMGPYLSGVLQDWSGNFNSTFLMITVFGIIGFAIASLLKKIEDRT
ncbi:MAG: MFS transporter [Gallicola sp.]|nr:MFS transporter [Gallicola sp.]